MEDAYKENAVTGGHVCYRDQCDGVTRSPIRDKCKPSNSSCAVHAGPDHDRKQLWLSQISLCLVMSCRIASIADAPSAIAQTRHHASICINSKELLKFFFS